MSTRTALRLFLTALALGGCHDPVVSPLLPGDVALAKGGPDASQQVDFTVTDSAMSLVSDGKGIYRNGVCGVSGSWSNDILFLAPAGASIPKSQKASCTGIAPRKATLTLALRHVSDNPHVDDAPGGGVYDVVNVKFGFGSASATTINSSAPCGTAGLRFTPITYPGSDFTVREDLGGGLWHLYTRPWPDNRAYCENGGVVTFWHVSFDINVQVVGT